MKKPGLEKLMRTKSELRELGGRILLGDYNSDLEIENRDNASSKTEMSLEMQALTFCRPGLAWALRQMEGIFNDYPDKNNIMNKLVVAAGKATGSGGLQEKNLMLVLISEAESIVEEKTTGRLTTIMKSAAALSSRA